jgi:2-methylfumaryl-CoA isomerase
VGGAVMGAVGPLQGMRIIEGSAFVAAPSGGMTLAQLGADVIRFDAIGGGLDYHRWPVLADDTSLYWAGLNKGKRSIQVDLRSPEGRELLAALIAAPGPDGGMFLTNFPATGWMSYDRLRQQRDDLIMVNIVGNHDGTTALDYTVNCAVGYPLVTGPVDATGPVNHVFPGWDVACGQAAAIALLAAERHRSRTGEGQLVRVALSDIALHVVASLGHVAEAQILGTERERLGNDLYGALGRDFATADGRRLIAVAISPKQWESLCEATGITDAMAELAVAEGLDLATREADRYAVRDRIFAAIEAWTSAHSLADIATRFDALGVCWGPYQTFRQLVADDPRCSTANPMFTDLEQPGIGRYLVPGSPLAFEQLGRVPPAAAPALGQHTDEVLAEVLGLATLELARLHDAGVIAGVGPLH